MNIKKIYQIKRRGLHSLTFAKMFIFGFYTLACAVFHIETVFVNKLILHLRAQ